VRAFVPLVVSHFENRDEFRRGEGRTDNGD